MKKMNMQENDKVLKVVRYYNNRAKNLDNTISTLQNNKRVNFLIQLK
jgi:hypothetical protein